LIKKLEISYLCKIHQCIIVLSQAQKLPQSRVFKNPIIYWMATKILVVMNTSNLKMPMVNGLGNEAF
jgi:hypothetical protein